MEGNLCNGNSILTLPSASLFVERLIFFNIIYIVYMYVYNSIYIYNVYCLFDILDIIYYIFFTNKNWEMVIKSTTYLMIESGSVEVFRINGGK